MPTADVTTVDAHTEHVRDLLARLAGRIGAEREELPLRDALSRVTAVEIASPVDLPLFRNSQMDGFAVLSSDLGQTPVTLPVVADQPAGTAIAGALRPGTAIRIMTGAMVPDGADCIVPVEQTTFVPGPHGSVVGGAVTIERARDAGEYVRERGSDLRAGDSLLPAGLRLAPRHVAALAAAGLATVWVQRRVRVAAITTGAELVLDDSNPSPELGQIFDANLIALITAVRECGAEVVLAEATDDVAEHLVALLERAVASGADLILTSGGISQGAFEVVREALEPLGANVTTVAMQPGGPQATALFKGVPVVSFPGNPVSTQVSFVVFVRPLLRELSGLPVIETATYPLAGGVDSVAGKRQFLRGRYVDGISHTGSENARRRAGWPHRRVEVVAGPSSHLVAAMAQADVLIDIPSEKTHLSAGEVVRVWVL